MGTSVVQQPQDQKTPAPPAAGGAVTAATPNDQAAATADAERRRKAFAALPKTWVGALGGLAPPDAGGASPTVKLAGGDAGKLQEAAYKLAKTDAAGLKLAIDYLTAAGAEDKYVAALRMAGDNCKTDDATFGDLSTAIAALTQNHQDINGPGVLVLAKLALVTDDGKAYLRSTQGQPVVKPLDDLIAKITGDDEAAVASRNAYTALANAIKNPPIANKPAATVQTKPEPLTDAELKSAKDLITKIKGVFAGMKPLDAKADAKTVAAQKVSPQQMKQLQGLVSGASPRIKDWVYAWRDDQVGPTKGKGVLELMGSYMSPSQVEEVNAILDPVERLHKEVFDLKNGLRDEKAPKTSVYQLMHDFLVAYAADEATRKRVQAHAPLMQQSVRWLSPEEYKTVLRLIVTGKEEANAVDKVHEAADKGDSNAACAAIFELGKEPASLQKLRADLIFVHRLKDQCGQRIKFNGVDTTAYELFLRMCGVDPNDTKEAGSVDKQGEVDPNKNSEPPSAEKLALVEDTLYKPFAKKLADELNSWYTKDSNVMKWLREFQTAAATPDMVDICRRGHIAPGKTLADRIQAQGCDVRLKCQRGLSDDNLHEAERILGFVADQATTGVIGGEGALATDNKPKNGEGKVSLEQALRETTLESGAVLTQVIHDKAAELAGELSRWFGARADHVRSIWNSYKADVNDKVCADLREKTGLARVWAIELLSNAFLPIGGGSLESKLKSELGKEHNDVITEMGMSPTDIAARRTLAEQKAVQDNKDESKNTALMTDATAQVKQAEQSEQFRAPAKALFDGLAGVMRGADDTVLRSLGSQLDAGLKLASSGPAPAGVTAGVKPAPAAEFDVSAKPGGPVHPGQGTPTDFTSFYKKEYGIDPRRHAAEVAKALVTPERTAQHIATLLGIDASQLGPAQKPDDGGEKFVIDASNQTLVGPDFSIAEAEKRAKKMWDLLHENGQIQLVRQEFQGRTMEEQRLIHIAFRRLSGGIDLQFYFQQHLTQQKNFEANKQGEQVQLAVGGGGVGDADKRAIHVIGAIAETEAAAEMAATGKLSIERELSTLVTANNMNAVYTLLEKTSTEEKRAILANNDLMSKLRAFGDDSYEWNRIYKTLTGQADLFDRLESRAHGKHGFIGGAFEATDEKGMGEDIKAYAAQRKVQIRKDVIAEICGGKEPTNKDNKEMVDKEVVRRLKVEFAAHLENPSIRALLTDELSGNELAKTEGQLMNSGEESKVASVLTEGDMTEDEEKILDDIKKMTPKEREAARKNPEYIAQLQKAIHTQGTWRDAMTLLESTEDGSKNGGEDNFAKLEKASRSVRQDNTELMFEQDEVIEALSKLSAEEYARLKADPRLQAQILTSLEGHPEQLAKARQMMAFNADDAEGMTKLKVGDKADPAKGQYTKAQITRLAFLKFSAENQISVGASRGWGVLLQAAIAVYNMKLKPSDADKEAGGGGGGDEGSDKALTAKDLKPENQPAPAAPAGMPASATAKAPPTQAPAQEAKKDGGEPPQTEEGVEKRIRDEILTDTWAAFSGATAAWGTQKSEDASHQRTEIDEVKQQAIIKNAILHKEDPSNVLLMASTGVLGDDEDRIKDTLRKASEEKLIKEWTNCVQHSANGADSLKDKYNAWKTARTEAGRPIDAAPKQEPGAAAPSGDPKAAQKKKDPPKVGSKEWTARNQFKCHIVDTSDVLEDLLLKYTGGLFADDGKTAQDKEKHIKDNSEWLEWRTIVRDRIPNIDRKKIGIEIGAGADKDAMDVLEDPDAKLLSDTLGQLEYDDERYLVDRGKDSNYNIDRLTAGGEGLALDNAMADYRKQVLTGIISDPSKEGAGEEYGKIDAAEKARIDEAKARFNQSDSEFRAAKAAVANVAATVVALIITAIVTILTAGTATGPLLTIFYAAVTAAAASAGSNATKKAIQGTDFEFGKEGLQNIARDTLMAVVTAGTTYYAGKIVNGLFSASSAAEQAALVAKAAADPGFFMQMGRGMVENSLQTGMQGLFESGMAAFDPAMWLDGWNEGWRRGSHAARERAQEIPLEMVRAAAIAAMSHSANAGINKLTGAKPDGWHGQHADTGNRMDLGDRTAFTLKTMGHGAKEGVIMGASEVLLDEKTYRAEGAKPGEMLGHIAQSSAGMAQMSAGMSHMGDASGLHEKKAGEAAMEARSDAATRELLEHGSELKPAEQQMYKQLATEHGGNDTTVLTVKEFKEARRELVDRAVAEFEAREDRKVTPEERAKFEAHLEGATGITDYLARAQAGVGGTPGIQSKKLAEKFDTPAACDKERKRAAELLEKMGQSAEQGKTHAAGVAELGPKQVEAMTEAKKLIDELHASAKTPEDRAAVVALVSRLNMASSELSHNLQTAGGGASVEMVKDQLQVLLDAAAAAPNDASKHTALHQLLITAQVANETTPASAQRAAESAKKNLGDLTKLVDEIRNARDNAARRALSTTEAKTDPATAKEQNTAPVAEPVKDAKKEAPAATTEKDPNAEQEAKKDGQEAKDELAAKEAAAKGKADESTTTGGKTEAVMTAEAKAKSELGSQFAGNTLAADPMRANKGVQSALEHAAPPGSRVHGDVVEIPRGNEHVPLEVKVKVNAEAPSAEFAAVATMHMEGPDHIVITVSPGASEHAVERAVAGKLAEVEHLVRERLAGKRTDTTSALVEGSQSKDLSPQDHNQIAQVKAAIHQIEAAKAKGDAAGAEQLKREAYALVVGMGLLEAAPDKPLHKGPSTETRVVGPEASARRLEMIEKVLGADAAKLRALVGEARNDATTIGDIRTQRAAAREKLRAWCEEQIAARKEANKRLQGQVDAAIGADGTGKVFDKIIVGGGWAATADYISGGAHAAGDGVPGTIAISKGGDPWAGRGDLLMGQNPAELEMRGMAVQPSDLAADPHQFASSKDFSTAVGASAAASGMPTYEGSVTKIEQRPAGEAPGWPEGANWRISANGKTFFASHVDIVSGPGPARVPPAGNKIHDQSGYAADSHGDKFYKYTPGHSDEYHEVPASSVPAEVRARLEAERGSVSKTFVDHESGITVDTSSKPEKYRDKEGNEIPASAVPKEVAHRLGMNPGGADGGPSMVDASGRLQSTRVFDPESGHAIDVLSKKVYGPEGKEVDPATLSTEVRQRLGLNPDGSFRDPRFVAAGNGYSVNPVTGHVIETATGNEVDLSKLDDATRKQLETEMEKRRVGFGGQRMADEYSAGADGKKPDVLIYGAGASGAWDVEQAAAGGANIDWSGRLRLPKPEQFPPGSETRTKLEKLHDPKTSPEERQQLMKDLRDVINAESFKDGFNRRNTLPGVGAYSPEVLDKLDQNARSIVDIQPTTDGRFYVRFSDGTSHVYDKVTVSIGQDAAGPGGVGDLTKGMELKPLRTGGGDIAGAQDSSGTLQIKGAAGASGPIVNQLPPEARKEIRDQAGELPNDSKNIAPAIRNQAGRIAGVNEPDIGGTKALSPEERQQLDKMVKEHGLVDGPEKFREWKAAKDGTETGASSTTNGDKVVEQKPVKNAPEVTERAKGMFAKMDAATRTKHEELFSKAENQGQRILLERALAAGHSLAELEQLRYAMAGLGDVDVLREFSGQGVVQFYQQSCVPTAYQIALANVDPVFAFKLRNNPEMVMEAQRNALVIGGGAQTPREDLHKPPEALKEQLDDPKTAKKLKDSDSYSGKGSSGGIEPTEMIDQQLHKQLEKATGHKYEVITNDQLDYKKPGHGEFAKDGIPHDRIGKAVDANLPVIFGLAGHARVIIGRTVESDGSITYRVADPMDGSVTTMPGSTLDALGALAQSFTIPAEGKSSTMVAKSADPKTASKGDGSTTTGVITGLSPEQAAALGADHVASLPDGLSRQLKGVEPTELDRLGKMLTADPELAARIANKRNFKNALEKSTDMRGFEQHLFAQRLADLKVKGSNYERIMKAVRHAELDGRALEALSDTAIAALAEADTAIAKSREKHSPGDADMGKLREAIAAIERVPGAEALRGALSHQHDLSDIAFIVDPGKAVREKFPSVPKEKMDFLVTHHRDALRALEMASPEDVMRIIAALEAGNPKDVEDILRSYMYKAQKKARKSLDEGGTDGLFPPGYKESLGDRLETSLANLKEARDRGHPFGFEDKPHYDSFMSQLQNELAARDIHGTPKVQGSAMHSKTPGDVDVEIRVSADEFKRLAAKFLADAPEGKGKTDLKRNIEKGKIPSFHFFPNVAPSIGESVAKHTKNPTTGEPLSCQATLIVEGTDFDLGPTMD
ncbi:MAG: hypothetical protein HOV81_35635 [Kofleriaceae bacterium]|nr:hypothetical protein [Kofleriaceae bacterium]